MSYTVFNPTHVNRLKEPLFMGAGGNLLRFDVQKYPTLEKYADKQMGFFWRPEEIDVSQDKHEFANLPEHEKHIFISNLRLQTLADSMAGRSISVALLQLCSQPELEAWYELVAMFEANIHAKSYSHVIRNVFNSPDEVFDGILDIPEVVARASQMGNNFDAAIRYMELVNILGYGKHIINGEEVLLTSYELKKHLVKSLVSLYILEGIRFFTSFACSFAFAERELMEGNAKIIKLIARDETLHANAGAFVLSIIRAGKDDPEMAQAFEDLEAEGVIDSLFAHAVAEEKAWAQYLFKDGSMVGLNAAMLGQYIDWISDNRRSAIQLQRVSAVKSNPLPWMDSWIDSDAVQVAPQESEITSYLVGAVDMDVADDAFDGFEL